MRKCYLCGKKAAQATNISLHKFPNAQHLRKKWISACGLQESDDVSHIYICSLHFTLPQNCNVQVKWRLPPQAVPSADIVTSSPAERVIQSDAISEVPHVSSRESSNISELSEVQNISAVSEAIDSEVIRSEVMDSAIKDYEVMESKIIHSDILDNAVQPILAASTSHFCCTESVSTPRRKRLFAEPEIY